MIAKRSSQQGMGYWGIMAAIVCVILIGKIGLATIPAYLDNKMLEETITEKLATGGKKTGKQILESIQGQMNINSTTAGNVEDMVEIVRNTPGKVVLKTNYEVRSNLAGHVEIVSKFEKQFPE